MFALARRPILPIALTLIAACGGGAEEAIRDFEAINQEACACKDKACADATFTKMSALVDKHRQAQTRREADLETFAYWFRGAAACLVEQGVDRAQILALVAKME